jgi:hypothetical protein
MLTQVLWLMAACAAQGGTMTPEAPPQDLQLPTVILKAEQRYLLGLPLLVSVTFDNPRHGASFYQLPELSVLFREGPIGVQLQPVRGGKPVGFPPSDRRSGQMAMEPGEHRQMLLDLSNFGLDIPPGPYWLTLTLKVGRYSTTSQPVQTEFVKPSPTDEAEATRLRRLGSSPTDTGAWAPFLTDNWNTVTVSSELSAEAHQQLALHLFMHYALYGPYPVGKLDVTPLQQITSPVLQGEATVLQWEIRAASTPHELSPAMMGPSGGMEFRLRQIEKGEGFLTRYRKMLGAEQAFPRPPAFYPYK